jgi:hypothetical protein
MGEMEPGGLEHGPSSIHGIRPYLQGSRHVIMAVRRRRQAAVSIETAPRQCAAKEFTRMSMSRSTREDRGAWKPADYAWRMHDDRNLSISAEASGPVESV